MGVRLLVRSCWASGSEGDAVFEFDQSRITIGRGRGADVRLPHRGVSVRHATIEHTSRGYTLVDHETTNGTSVQGGRVVGGRPKPLREGDRIDLGGFTILFQSNVPIAQSTSRERTSSLARRLARDSFDAVPDDLKPQIVVLNGPTEGTVVPVPEPPARLTIGRDDACDLALRDADLSRVHAEIDVRFDGVWVRDLESKNGVYFAERAIDDRLLDDRDEVRVGSTVLRFEDPAAASVQALEEGEDDEVEVPVWEPEPEPEPEPSEASDASGAAGSEAAAEPDVKPEVKPARPGRSVAPADIVIYVLASVVFALSVLGLIWLLRSG